MALRGAAEHLHGGPCVQPAAGGEGDGTGAVQSDVREEPAVRRHAGLLGAPGRADDECGRLVDRPLARVPEVVREGQRTVARSRPGDLLRREWSRKGRVRVGLGHLVEPGPQCGDVVALLLGCHVLGGSQRILYERVLLHDGPDEAGRHLDRCHEVGRPRHHLVGLALRLLPAGVGARGAGPGAGLTSHHDHGVALARRHGGQGVVDQFLLRHADLVEHRRALRVSRCAGPRCGRDP